MPVSMTMTARVIPFTASMVVGWRDTGVDFVRRQPQNASVKCSQEDATYATVMPSDSIVITSVNNMAVSFMESVTGKLATVTVS